MKCCEDVDLALLQPLVLVHHRQAARLVVLVGIVAVFGVERQEAVELDHGAGRAQVDGAGARLGGDVGGGALEFGGFHLACQRAAPDQVVQLGLVGIEHLGEILRPAGDVGRADRLMRFLRILGLGLIGPRRARDIAGAIVRADGGADRLDGFRVHVDAVGTHISNEADRLALDLDALIEPLGDPHGVRRREAELAACLLLQGRGGEGREGIAPARLGLDLGDVEGGGLERLLECARLDTGADVEALDLPAVGADQARLNVSPRGVARVATSDQYSRAMNFSISSSRSHTSRSATDCTRPAERAPGSLRHSTGESVKPTR